MKALITLSLLLGVTAHAQSSAPTSDGISYTVKPHDTLYGLANRYFTHVADYRVLLRAYHIVIPQHLQSGTVLVLPRALLKYAPADAQLVAFRGDVTINGALPVIGAPVHEGAQITTTASSYATLILSNSSKLTIPSQTSLTLTRLRKLVIDNSLDYEISLDSGRIQTKATHFTDPNSRFQFKTPLATSAVRGTEFRVAYDKGANSDSLTEVLEGTVAVGAPKAAQPQLIPAHIGIGVSPTGATHTEQLLPPPEISNAADLQKEELVHFTLTPVAGAATYHVQLAHDAGFTDIFAGARTATPAVDFANVPNGNQFVRATALSASGFEGLVNSTAFVRKLNSIHAIVEKGGHGGFHFKWISAGEGIKHFRFQLVKQQDDAVPLVDEPGLTSTEIELTNLHPGIYFWRVESSLFDKGETSENWTDFEKLTIPKVKAH